LFLPLVSINDDQDFVRPNGGISTQIAVVHVQREHTLAHHGAQLFGYVHRPSLHSVETADDSQTSRVITRAIIAGPIFPGTVIPIWAAVIPVIASNGEHAHVDEHAFSEFELALFVSPVSRDNMKSLVFANRRIAAHSLIPDRDSAIHATTRNQIADKVRDVSALISESIVGANNPPAFILSAQRRGD
jgi:hypothetical protein